MNNFVNINMYCINIIVIAFVVGFFKLFFQCKHFSHIIYKYHKAADKSSTGNNWG